MTTFPAAGGRFREERDPWWFVVDPLLILSVMAITAMGALLVYSATRGPATELDPADTSFLTRQVFFAVVGAGLGLFAALINIERIRSLVSVAYISTLGLLLGILLFGADINGTQAWYRLGGFTFQPSEPGKLVLIVTLATVFSGDRVGFQRMAAGLLLAGVPIGLILLQPDLGTVLVYIVVTAVMIMMSNISMRLILLLVLAAITAITMIFTSDVLEDYQKDRLTVSCLMTTPSPSWAPTPCGSPTTPSNPRSPSATGADRDRLVPGHTDQLEPCARTADRLHLLGGGGGARLSWRCDPARVVRRGRCADLAGRCPGL